MPSTEREDCDICDKTGTRPDVGLGGSVSPHASSDLATFKIPMPFASCFRTLRLVALWRDGTSTTNASSCSY
jgi:hypothetical protein